MRHPNIAQLMAVCYGPAKTDLFLVLEPLQDGSLHYKIHEDNFSYTESEALEIIWGIANGRPTSCTVETLNNGTFGTSYSVHYREVPFFRAYKCVSTIGK